MLGRSVNEALYQVNFDTAIGLRTEVRRHFGRQQYDQVDAREKLSEPVLTRLGKLLKSLKDNDPTSPYSAVDRAADVALEAIKSRRI